MTPNEDAFMHSKFPSISTLSYRQLTRIHVLERFLSPSPDSPHRTNHKLPVYPPRAEIVPSFEMATSAHGNRGGNTTTANDDRAAIASAVQAQLSHVSSFDRWLLRRVESDRDHGGVVSKVRERLERYRKWLLATEQALEEVSDGVEPWAMTAQEAPGSGPERKITVTGPGEHGGGRPIEIVAKDEQEAGYLLGVCSCVLLFCSTVNQCVPCPSADLICRSHTG